MIDLERGAASVSDTTTTRKTIATQSKHTRSEKVNDLDDVQRFGSSISKEDTDDTLPQCLICFEPFQNDDAVTTHCVGNSYHRHCIMEWLMKHDRCPYCRRPFFQATLLSDCTASVIESSTIMTSSVRMTRIIPDGVTVELPPISTNTILHPTDEHVSAGR
jgi:Ring finger domain